MSDPFAPPTREGVAAVCNDRQGKIAVVGDQVVFRPLDGEPAHLVIDDLIVVSCTRTGRHTIGLPVAILVFVVALELELPYELTVAVSVWCGVIAAAIGALLYPVVNVDLEGAEGGAWSVTSHDSELFLIARDLRRRLRNPSRRTTAWEMVSDGAATLIQPGDDFPWTRRAFAAWMVVSLPGPALIGATLVALAVGGWGGSASAAFAGALGVLVAIGQVALLPGLLLQLPTMWLIRRSGLVRAV